MYGGRLSRIWTGVSSKQPGKELAELIRSFAKQARIRVFELPRRHADGEVQPLRRCIVTVRKEILTAPGCRDKRWRRARPGDRCIHLQPDSDVVENEFVLRGYERRFSRFERHRDNEPGRVRTCLL